MQDIELRGIRNGATDLYKMQKFLFRGTQLLLVFQRIVLGSTLVEFQCSIQAWTEMHSLTNAMLAANRTK